MLLLFVFAALISCENWAILTAGSRGYGNYRHQADVCQAYQQLHKMGIPDERIITFMYDDIAHNIRNPHKGKIINYPGGPDVYEGVVKDYTGIHVCPKNFKKVLMGESLDVGSGKTLKSTENDNVFIYFTDHGGYGSIAFPAYLVYQELLHAKELHKVLEHMHENKMYKNLVFYIEACESGSMFWDYEKLESLNIFGVTASNPWESSWACDYDDYAKSYLNDCWSKWWMNDSRDAIDKEIFDSRTLWEQWTYVKKVSDQSPECAYGDLSFVNTSTLMDFQGQKGSKVSSSPKTYPYSHSSSSSAVRSEDVTLDLLRRTGTEEEINKHLELLNERKLFWDKFTSFFELDTTISNDEDRCHTKSGNGLIDCHYDLVKIYENKCGGFLDEDLSMGTKHLYFACRQGIDFNDVGKFFIEMCQ